MTTGGKAKLSHGKKSITGGEEWQRLRKIAPDWAAKVKQLEDVQEGWDGHAARPPARSALDSAVLVLLWMNESLPLNSATLQFFVPTPDGGVELGLCTKHGNELMLTVPLAGPVRYVASLLQENGTFDDVGGDVLAPERLRDVLLGLTREVES